MSKCLLKKNGGGGLGQQTYFLMKSDYLEEVYKKIKG